MDFKKSKVLLKKINAIYESGEAFNHEFSSLEKDLLLQYLREFYECITNPIDVATNAMVHNGSSEKVETKNDHVTSKIIEPQPARSKEELTLTTTSSNVSHAIEESVATTKVVAEIQEPSAQLGEDVAELFIEKDPMDLSNRFANQPINDVAKAMGINERILTINELFGGDQQAFLSIVNRLNNAENFEAASHILENDVIGRFEWTKSSRQKKAKIFIQLVRRRFL